MATVACPRCGSHQTTAGLIASGGGHGAGVFIPCRLRWWSFRLWPGVPLRTPHAGCLSCGLIWAETAPERLRAFIEEYGTAASRGSPPGSDLRDPDSSPA